MSLVLRWSHYTFYIFLFVAHGDISAKRPKIPSLSKLAMSISKHLVVAKKTRQTTRAFNRNLLAVSLI